jgi:hypothetical protein
MNSNVNQVDEEIDHKYGLNYLLVMNLELEDLGKDKESFI